MTLSSLNIDENHQKSLTTLFCIALINKWKYSNTAIQMALKEEFRHYSPEFLKQLIEDYCNDKPLEVKKQLIDLISNCSS